ncbi:MAG TPA: fibronectin type III domain-containing protein, partial [Solirubrobacteraceae bacterium]|nr:fibronectin type III domain-containing protein [Solirubrobacteraceae bacterium]
VGGTASVRFYLGGDQVKTVEIQQDETGEGGNGFASPDEIQVTAPDLSALQKQIPEGQTKLVVDVGVVFLDKEGNEVGSPITSADRFTLDTLGITSADAATFTVGDTKSFAVTAQGAKPTTLKETGPLPEGVEFAETEEGAAELTGTPAEGSAGVYPLTITASNGTDPDATQNFTLKVQDVPGAPENVTASAGVESGGVTWTAPSSDGESDIESYVVTANPGGESATVAATATSAVIEGLTAGTGYTFNVSAVNAVGESQPGTSNSVVVTSTELEEEHEATSTEPDGAATTEPVSSPDGSTLTATGEGEGTVHVGVYASDPVAQLSDGTSYFDVATSTGSKFTSVDFKLCGIEAGASVQWWNPATRTWQTASNQTEPTGEPPCVTVTVDATTSPSLSDLDGTIFAVTTPRKSGEETPVTHETPKTPEGGTSTGSTTTSSSGVAGFTTKSSPKISLAKPVKITAGSVHVSLQCSSGSGHCPTVTLQLTVTEHLHDHRVGAITAGATTRKVVIGQLNVTLAAGQSKVVTLSLNSAGKRLLKTHRSFKAHLTVRAENAIVRAQAVTIARKTKG